MTQRTASSGVRVVRDGQVVSAARFLRGRIRAVRAELRACQSVYAAGVIHGSALDRITSVQMTALSRDLAELSAQLEAVTS